MSRTYHSGEVEAHSFEELTRRSPDLPPAGRALVFDSASEEAQAACWADVRRYADGRTEAENIYAGRLVEPYCAECGDRTRVHESGDCTRHQPAVRSHAASSTVAGTVAVTTGDPLKRVPPREYVAAFTGMAVPASNKVWCPLHDERGEPSFHVYPDHWHCFGCNKTGGVYELASWLTGLSTRGPDFLKLRRWVAARLLEWRGAPRA